MTEEIVSALIQAVDGLLYQSETDAPFEVFVWPECPSPLTVDEITARLKQTPVQQQSAAQFFTNLTQEKDWYGPAERATALRYRHLQSVVQEQLPDAQVFRVGKREVTIYIVGHAHEGKCIGLKTKAVET